MKYRIVTNGVTYKVQWWRGFWWFGSWADFGYGDGGPFKTLDEAKQRMEYHQRENARTEGPWRNVNEGDRMVTLAWVFIVMVFLLMILVALLK